MKKLVSHAYDVSIRYVCNLLSPHSGLWQLVIGCITLLLCSINVSAQTTPFWGDVEPYLPNSTSTGTGVNTNMPLGSACNATCDYIANGNFSAISPTDISCGPMVNWNSANNRFIDCWNRYAGTPDLYTADCNHLSVSHEGVQEFTDSYVIGETGNAFVKNCSAGSNEASSPSGGNFIGLTANRDEDGDIMQEAIMTRFPIPLVNGVYIITIDAKVFCTDQENLNHAVFFRGSTSSGLSGLGPSGGGGGNNFDEADTSFENLGFFNATGSGWHTYTIPFTYTGNTPINYFIIGRQAFIDNSTCSYVMFDNVRLTRVNSTMGAIPPVCVETTLNLFDYTNLDYNQGSFSVLYNGVTTPLSDAIFTPHMPGNYIITYTPPNDNCPSSSTTLLVNYATTTASVSPSIACWGTSVQFSTPTVAPLPNSYQWTGPNGFSSTQQNPTLNAVTVPMSGVYSVSTTAANGCIATAHVSLQVRNNPVINVAVIPASCTTDGSATATASGGSAPYTYIWSNGATTANITGLIAGVYTVTTTDINGCTATGSATVGFMGIAGGQAVGDGVGIPNAGSAGAAAVLSLTSFYVVGSFNTGGVLNSNSLALTNQTVKMVPGAQIVVPNGKTFALRGSTVKAECQKLWKRILVEDGGNLTTDASGANSQTTIRDGHYAVWLNNGAKTLIKNATFTDNFIGVYAPPNNSTGNTWVQSVGNMTGCTFTATTLNTNILMPYTGAAGTPIPSSSAANTNINIQIPLVTPRLPFAGVVLNDITSEIKIGLAGLGRNTFSNTRRGIVDIRCRDIFVNNSQFNDFTVTNINTPVLVHEGQAITAIGKPNFFVVSCKIDIADGGDLSNSPVTFSNNFVGVYSDRVSINVTNLRMQDIRTGVFASTVRNGFISVSNTRMDNCIYRGIDLADNSPTVTSIYTCTLNMNSNSSLADGAILIRDASTAVSANSVVINGNIITMGNKTKTGISINNTYNTKIVSNIITCTDSLNNKAAIRASGSKKVHINCNTVNTTFAPDAYLPAPQSYNGSVGLDIVNVNDGYYEGNQFINTYIGAGFNGLNLNTNLRDNKFDSNYYGLFLAPNAVIGDQKGPNAGNHPEYNYGNRWNGVHLGAKAINRNLSSNIVEQSQIYYNPNAGSEFAPSPSQIIMMNNIDPDLWFVPSPITRATYGTTSLMPDQTRCWDFSGNMEKILLEQVIADGDISTSNWQTEINRTADKDLLAKLVENPDLLNDQSFMAFFQSMLNSREINFYDIKASQASAFDITLSDKLTINQQKMEVDSLYHQLSLVYNAYDDINADSAVLDIQLITLKNQIAGLEQSINNLSTGYTTQLLQKLNAAQVANTAIINPDVYEYNEKRFNEIYLISFAKGVTTLSPQDLQDLYSIAIQCPLAGGAAVWSARSLYANYASLNYNDIDNCAAVNIVWKSSEINPVSKSIKVYPNPTSDVLNIALPKFETGNISISISDLLGHSVLKQTFDGQLEFATIDLSSVSNGLYLINIAHDGQSLLTDKVTVMKP